MYFEKDWSNTPKKQWVRETIFRSAGTVGSALLLPGRLLRCVSTGLHMGTITGSSRLYLVEEQGNVFQDIVEAAKDLPCYAELIRENVFNMEPSKYLDLVFLDLCGTLPPQGVAWLSDWLLPCLSDNAVVAITVNGCFRNCPFSKAAHHLFFNEYKELTQSEGIRFKCRHESEELLVYLMMIRTISKNAFIPEKIIKYKDGRFGNKMYCFLMRYSVSQEVTDQTAEPDLRAIIEEFRNFKEYVMASGSKRVSVRSRPIKHGVRARKAVATRVKNAAARKRSEAARKAWITRRSQSV